MTLHEFGVNHINLCVEYSNGTSYKDPIKMFRMRQEFAKKTSMHFFQKSYEELTLEEKFNITYMVTNTNIQTSLKDFILESGFRNLFKNKKEEIINYKLLDSLKMKFTIDLNDQNENVNDEHKKKLKNITKDLLEKRLQDNFLYRIYNQSIKKPLEEITVPIINNFKNMLKNSTNQNVITKLKNKLYLQRECVSACMIMGVQKYCYSDVDGNWLDLKKEIKMLKSHCNLPIKELKGLIYETFKKYFMLTPHHKTRPLDKRVNRNYINSELKARVKPSKYTVEELVMMGKQAYVNI